MSHVLMLPILLPMLAGSMLLLGVSLPEALKRLISLLATWALLPLAFYLAWQASDGALQVYAVGNWQPPFGIVLMLDRLSALMLCVNAVLASLVIIHACRGDDRRGSNFHALFQFQLLGINGAFLTGDLFNLFVFFEILLIASYSLLLHGVNAKRVRAGVHYVVLNLLGSSFFLIGVGILYGLTGSLNMADLAHKVSLAGADDQPLLAAAGYLLLVVFALKAALLPLYFWLPSAYSAACAPVAALFAIMTKVGLYAIIRVFTLIYGDEAGGLADMGRSLMWVLALLTVSAGVIGALAARDLKVLLSYLVVVSVGTLLAGFAHGTVESLSAALYYLIHSTLVMGGMFLLADMIARQRGALLGSQLEPGPALLQPRLLSGLFFAGAIAVAGLPPFSGFLGKVMLLQAVGFQGGAWLWVVLLVGGLVTVVALSRAGSAVFWNVQGEVLASAERDGIRLLATVLLLGSSLVLVVAADPIRAYTEATASQLLALQPYLQIVRGSAP